MCSNCTFKYNPLTLLTYVDILQAVLHKTSMYKMQMKKKRFNFFVYKNYLYHNILIRSTGKICLRTFPISTILRTENFSSIFHKITVCTSFARYGR